MSRESYHGVFNLTDCAATAINLTVLTERAMTSGNLCPECGLYPLAAKSTRMAYKADMKVQKPGQRKSG